MQKSIKRSSGENVKDAACTCMEANCSIHLSHLNVMCRARPTVCGASCSLRAGKDVGYDPPHRPCTAAVLLACIRSLYQIYCNCKLQETLCMLCILVEVISRTFGNFFAASQIVAVCNTDGSHLCKPANRQRSEEHLWSGTVNSFKLW